MKQEELRNIIRSEIQNVVKEGELEDYKLPAQAERYLNKAVDAIKGANLNRKRQVATIVKNKKEKNSKDRQKN